MKSSYELWIGARYAGMARARRKDGRKDRFVSFIAATSMAGIALGVETATGRGDSGDIEVDLPEVIQDLAEALDAVGRVFGLFIDELQDLDAELLRALLVAQHQAGQREWPFYLIGAGLPNLPTKLAETQSYAERLFDYRTIARLPAAEATAALVDPDAGAVRSPRSGDSR